MNSNLAYLRVDWVLPLGLIGNNLSDGLRAKKIIPGKTFWHSDMSIEEVDAPWCPPHPIHLHCLKKRRIEQSQVYQPNFKE